MRLADFIHANMAHLLQEWLSFARSLDATKAMSQDALLDHAKQMLDWIAKDVMTSQSDDEQFEKSLGRGNLLGTAHHDLSALLHGEMRFESGFSVEQLVAEYRALRASVLHLWKKASKAEQFPLDTDDMTRFNEAIDQVLAEAVESFSKLKEQQVRYLDTILSSSIDHSCVLGLDGRFLYANKSLASWFNLSQHQIIGKNLFDLGVAKAKEFHQQIDQVIHSKQPFRTEIAYDAVPEKLRFFEYVFTPLLREDGEVEAVTGMARDITERKASEDEIWHKANYDVLTGLPNRRLFRDRLEQEIKQSERSGIPVALLFLDLDRFKEANDMFGHDAGDLLLRQAAERIRSCMRIKDTVARLGGDEFTVILSDIDTTDHVENVANKILRELARPFIVLNETVHISASIGITVFPADGNNCERLIQNADRAMYVAKNAGRNQFYFFTPKLHEAAQARYQLIVDLREALAQRQLVVYFQPIVNLSTGAIYKAEALVRWLHPERGLVLPGEFISLAEDSGLIGEIGDWVFAEAAKQSKRWEDMFGNPIQISVNKSPLEFRAPQSNQLDWATYLSEIGLRSSSISLEITEGTLMNTTVEAEKKLQVMHDGGIQLAIDDFGTGYSSMSYLNKYDIDYVKIDQSFVQEMSTKRRSRTIAESIIAMAHKLGLEVIAEGVETADQRNWLKKSRCDFAQGFLFAAPAPADAFQAMLEANRMVTGHGPRSPA